MDSIIKEFLSRGQNDDGDDIDDAELDKLAGRKDVEKAIQGLLASVLNSDITQGQDIKIKVLAKNHFVTGAINMIIYWKKYFLSITPKLHV